MPKMDDFIKKLEELRNDTEYVKYNAEDAIEEIEQQVSSLVEQIDDVLENESLPNIHTPLFTDIFWKDKRKRFDDHLTIDGSEVQTVHIVPSSNG